MRDSLASDVQQVQVAGYDLAAIEADGSVVTWGRCSISGDSSAVRDLLASDVQQVQGAGYAFAAIEADDSVVTWGLSGLGVIVERSGTNKKTRGCASGT